MWYELVLNLKRIFLGYDFSIFGILETIFRTSFIFLYALVNIYFLYRRNIIHFSSSEFILVLAFGTAIGDAMLYSTVPLLSVMIIITTSILLVKLLLKLAIHFDLIEKIAIGSHTLIIENGHIKKEELESKGISEEQLFELLRLQGIKHTGEVEYAFIESVGQISIIKAKDPTKEGLSTLHNIKKHL